MNANPILLQKKYSRVLQLFAEEMKITLDSALDFFYQSQLYPLVSEGISDMHCMSDQYLAQELVQEYTEKCGKKVYNIFQTKEGSR